MRQASTRLSVATPGAGFTDLTDTIARWLAEQGAGDGLLTIFCRHTSASLLIQENADPAVLEDLMTWFVRQAPEGAGYRHDDEGPDDMPAHLRTALTQTTLSIPLQGGRLVLGTWQAIYLVEHRRAPHRREIALHLISD